MTVKSTVKANQEGIRISSRFFSPSGPHQRPVHATRGDSYVGRKGEKEREKERGRERERERETERERKKDRKAKRERENQRIR